MDKNILIIGASGDIGLAIAEELALSGNQLLLHCYRNKDILRQMENKIGQDNILSVIQANLATDEGVRELLNGIVYHIDAIVFASGTAHYGLFQNIFDETIDDMLSLHVKAPLKIAKHLLPQMIKQRFGKIIFITSIWGSVGASHEVMYSTVKGAQESFVKSLAKEVATCGVSVNGVSPGFIDTKMNHHFKDEEREALIADIPMNRPGTAREVAQVVDFLLGDKSSYIQGEIIEVTGGW